MKRVLVTGGAGFIGSHLVARLAGRGCDLVVLDNLKRARPGLPAELAELDGISFIEGDVRDRELVRSVSARCDTVFHLAAQSNVLGALADPDYSFTTNVVGTHNVLMACADQGVSRLVFTSSREVYGEARRIPVDEEQALSAKNPYGASKVSGEAYVRTFEHCHGLDTAVLRLANVYGAGDRDRVIPLWLNRAQRQEDLVVYGGEQVLDFVWIETVIDALVTAGECGLDGPVNVGSGTGTPIRELARRVIEETGSASRIIQEPAREAEVTRFVADVTRLGRLGITPDVDPLAHLGDVASCNGFCHGS